VLPDKVWRRIVAERSKGLALGAIADKLNKEGVPTAREGNRWHASTVAHVVRSVALDKELTKIRSGQQRRISDRGATSGSR